MVFELLLRRKLWEAKLATKDVSDQINVSNLQVAAKAGLDAWGREKEQPILVTVTATLAHPFDSAADADSIDGSTVHYGKLSKDIRARIEESNKPEGYTPTLGLLFLIKSQMDETAGGTRLEAAEIDIFYPKGSMLGDGAGISEAAYYGGESRFMSRVLYLKNVRIPCIIGVNSNERLQKQPVVVNLWIECLPEERMDDYPQLEGVLVETIWESSFETLESLSTMVVKQLRQKFFRKGDEGAFIRLRLEKPMAVPFADAPSIEIVRPVRT